MKLDRRERAVTVAGLGLAAMWLLFCIAMSGSYHWSLYLSSWSIGGGYAKIAWGWAFIAGLTVVALATLRAWLGKPLMPRLDASEKGSSAARAATPQLNQNARAQPVFPRQLSERMRMLLSRAQQLGFQVKISNLCIEVSRGTTGMFLYDEEQIGPLESAVAHAEASSTKAVQQ